MGSHHVLVSCPLILDSIDDYANQLAEYDITYDVADVDQQLDEDDLLNIIERYDGIIAGDDELNRRVLERGTNLKVISKWGIGTDNIDFDAAEEFGIEIYNTPGAFADEVADVVIGYTITISRCLHRIDQSVREGEWVCPRGVSLADKTFGVIGVGNIGSAVARRAHALGMDVLGNDVQSIPDELQRDITIRAAEKDELLADADIVSLNCALTTSTNGLIGKDELDLLGSEGYLVNTSRGELVDQAALVDALQEERIAGAALDVFREEPLPSSSPLTDLDNVVLGSHNAQNTVEAVSRVNDRAIENLLEGLGVST